MIQRKYGVIPLRRLIRQLWTSRYTLYPRGVPNSVKRNGKYVIEEQNPPTPPLSVNPKALKDVRPIDSIDPVILKYTEILNNTPHKSGEYQENVYDTHFGSIRFDSDNVPGANRYFDIEGTDSKVVSIRDNIHSFYKSSRSKDDTQSVHDSNQSERELSPGNSEINTSEENSIESQRREGSSIYDDEKAFEELFCGAVSEYEPPSKYKMLKSNSGLIPMTHKVNSRNQDASYIDEQFFGSIDQNNEIDLNNRQHPQHILNSKNADFTKTSETPDMYKVEDLSYIDQTFFKPSLDILQENRKPGVDFRDIEKDIRRAFDDLQEPEQSFMNNEKDVTSQQGKYESSNVNFQSKPAAASIALNYLGIDPISVQSFKIKVPKMEEKKNQIQDEELPSKIAYDYVLKKRKEEHEMEFGLGKEGEEGAGNRSYQKVLSLLKDAKKNNFTKHDMFAMLKESVIYNSYDIVGLHKPYGLAMHEGTEGPHHTLTDFLPPLARYLKSDDLFIVHRLDATSTGVLLLARTPAMADTLKAMFKEQKIKKTYWAITKGIPSPLYGTIDIPIAEGSVDGKYRMVLKPDIQGLRGLQEKSHLAITGFRVMSKAYNTALVELTPKTGVKHQLRVHLGFGLACPILGDHKYSHMKKLAPQRLPGDTLERLKLAQSKVRNLPMFLHSRSVLIPEIVDGRNLFIKAKIPAFFNKTLTSLKLNTHKNQVRYADGKCIDKE